MMYLHMRPSPKSAGKESSSNPQESLCVDCRAQVEPSPCVSPLCTMPSNQAKKFSCSFPRTLNGESYLDGESFSACLHPRSFWPR